MAQRSSDAFVSAVADPPRGAWAPTVRTKRKWHMIQETTNLSFKGGYHTKAEAVESQDFILNNEVHRFVHVYKKAEWLCKMAGGQLKRAGQIMDDIRDQYAALASVVTDADTEEPEVTDPDHDPMAQCDTPEVAKPAIHKNAPSPQQKKRLAA